VTTIRGDVFTASYVISTLPLGVMQRNTVKWTPALDAAKVQAMYMLNFGTLDRITLVFNTNWWDSKKEDCWVNRLTADNEKNLFTEFYSLTNILNRNALVAFVAGDLAAPVRRC
jgi:monoamine oxidase